MTEQTNSSKTEPETQIKLIKATSRRGLITRTSQACDRCRIKKIKCDGKIPSCTNCLGIGYNCVTSDKLTRRSFPKCYTESLEKSLIALQNENAKLIHQNDLLKQQRSSVTSVEGNVNSFGLENTQSSNKMLPVHDENSISLNFFRYDNILLEDCYVGLNSFQTLYNNVCASQGIEVNKIKEKTHFPRKSSSFSVSEVILENFTDTFPTKNELDLIITNHFETFNSILPILDEDLFYNQYKTFFRYRNDESLITLGFLKNSSDTEIDFLTVLILIAQLNTHRFPFKDIYELICLTNFHQNNTIINFQVLLLSLQLLQSNGIQENRHKTLLTNLSNLSLTKVIGMGLHLNYNNLTKINVQNPSSEPFGQCNIYGVRLKLYWVSYTLNILNNLVFGHSNLRFLSTFDSYHIPRISSLINSSNSTSNLKTFDKFIKLVQCLNDVNILSDNVYKNNICSLEDFQTTELNIKEDNSFIREIEYQLVGKSLTQSNYVRLQLQFMVISFKFLLDVENDENSVNFLKMFKMLGDSSKLFRTLSGSSIQFNLFAMDISRICLMAVLSVLSRRSSNQVTTSLKYLIVSILKILKKCYPEVFVDNQMIIKYFKEKIDYSDEDLTNSSTVALSLSSICHNEGTSSLYNESLQTTGLFSHLQNYRTYSENRMTDPPSYSTRPFDYTVNTILNSQDESELDGNGKTSKSGEMNNLTHEILTDQSHLIHSRIW